MQYLFRFLIGGAFVSLFAVLGDSFKPKSFAGTFGSAPSIALAGFLLTVQSDGPATVVLEAKAMQWGAVALFLYSLSCAWVVGHTKMRPWLAAWLLWAEWLGASLLFYRVALR